MSATIRERPKVQRETLPPRPRVVLQNVSWDTYKRLSDEACNDSHVRMIYDRGRLEIVSPAPRHERYKTLLRRFAEDVLVALQIQFEEGGESRWLREAAERGLEADDSFFISFDKVEIVAGRPADRHDDPLPDLAIEVDTSDHAADRMRVYAALGIPEVWTYDGDKLRIFRLRDDATYEEIPASRFLPVTAEEVSEWIGHGEGISITDWINALQVWLREEFVPRQAGDQG